MPTSINRDINVRAYYYASAGSANGHRAGPFACDQDQVLQAVGERHPDAAVVVPPWAGAVASAAAETAPTQRERHLRMIAERGRMVWQKASGVLILMTSMRRDMTFVHADMRTG